MNTIHTLYTKDKKVKVTFRCDDAMSAWLTERSGLIGLTPSAFVRQTLYQQMYAEKTIGGMIKDNIKEAASSETAVTNANHKARK